MRLVRSLAMVLAVAVTLVVPAAPSFAASQSATGSFVEGPVENEQFVGVRGGAEIYTLSRDVWFSGTYEGAARADQTIAIRADGSVRLRLAIRFSGTVCGEPATLVFHAVGHGNLFEGELTGRYVVFDGGRASGTGSFVGVPNVGGDYEGKAQCR